MSERGSKYVPIVDAIIMQERHIVVGKSAKTFAGLYINRTGEPAYLREFRSISHSLGDGERYYHDKCWNTVGKDVELAQVESAHTDPLKTIENILLRLISINVLYNYCTSLLWYQGLE